MCSFGGKSGGNRVGRRVAVIQQLDSFGDECLRLAKLHIFEPRRGSIAHGLRLVNGLLQKGIGICIGGCKSRRSSEPF